MYKTILTYDNTTQSSETQAWDDVQSDLFCCGVSQPSDWWNNTAYEDGTYPDSCFCKNANGCDKTARYDLFSTGCYDTVINKIQGSWREWGGALIAFAVLEAVGIIAGIIFLKKMKTSGYYLA